MMEKVSTICAVCDVVLALSHISVFNKNAVAADKFSNISDFCRKCHYLVKLTVNLQVKKNSQVKMSYGPFNICSLYLLYIINVC